MNPHQLRRRADTGNDMKRALLITLALCVAGCGSSPPRDARVSTVTRAVPLATGPISQACLQSSRKAKSRSLCGCIQSVANQILSPGQQRRSVEFYSNPHLAQQIRQSDKPVDEKFWNAYKAYGVRAEQKCG